MDKIDKETENKVRELQILEQSLSQLMFQKQTFQLEVNELDSATSELEDSKGDVFKIVGSIMIKSEKEKLKKSLQEKKDMLDLRIKNLEKQEKALSGRVDELRKAVLSQIQ